MIVGDVGDRLVCAGGGVVDDGGSKGFGGGGAGVGEGVGNGVGWE